MRAATRVRLPSTPRTVLYRDRRYINRADAHQSLRTCTSFFRQHRFQGTENVTDIAMPTQSTRGMSDVTVRQSARCGYRHTGCNSIRMVQYLPNLGKYILLVLRRKTFRIFLSLEINLNFSLEGFHHFSVL